MVVERRATTLFFHLHWLVSRQVRYIDRPSETSHARLGAGLHTVPQSPIVHCNITGSGGDADLFIVRSVGDEVRLPEVETPHMLVVSTGKQTKPGVTFVRIFCIKMNTKVEHSLGSP